jgi:hypothetical protein
MMVRKQIYIMVRMPYLNLSDKEFYFISSSLYIFIVLIAHVFGSTYSDPKRGHILSSIDKVSSGIVPISIMYILAGHFYYMAC